MANGSSGASFGSHRCYGLRSGSGIFCKLTLPFLGQINLRFGNLRCRLYLELCRFRC